MGNKERILIADDMEVSRDCTRRLIEAFGPDHEIVGEADSVREVVEFLQLGIDVTVAIVDGKMPNDGDGELAAEIIREKSPTTRIIAYSSQKQTFGDINVNKGLTSGKQLVQIINDL